jgi:hypothetical protein
MTCLVHLAASSLLFSLTQALRGRYTVPIKQKGKLRLREVKETFSQSAF